MPFETYVPAEPLSRFIEMLWHFSGPGPMHRRERVLPDGTAELIVNLDDVPRKRFDHADLRRFQTVRRAWISGPQPEYLLIDVLPRANMIGVHFRPGGLAPFVELPAGELCGELVELESLWGRAAGDLREALLECSSVKAQFRCLESFLWQRARQLTGLTPTVAEALRQFGDDSVVPRIEECARQLGMSHKHFIACFRAEVGLSPKLYCRIRRFRRALGELQARREVNWTDVVYAHGYYDQAHFIHEFRKFSGLTPGVLRQQPGADLRFVPLND